MLANRKITSMNYTITSVAQVSSKKPFGHSKVLKTDGLR
jgi:hypothetical protein